MSNVESVSTDSTHRSINSALSVRSALVALAVILPLAAASVLAYAVHVTPFIPFDLTVTRAVQAFNPQWFDLLMRGVSWPGYPPQAFFLVALIFVVLYLAGLHWEAYGHAFASIGIGILGLVFKYPVDRPRPDPHLINVWDPNLEGGRRSFPAGHVETNVAILGFLVYLLIVRARPSWARTGAIVFLSAVIVLTGISRIYSGEHWFTDVVGGYLIGTAMLIATIKFYEWGRRRASTDAHTGKRISG